MNYKLQSSISGEKTVYVKFRSNNGGETVIQKIFVTLDKDSKTQTLSTQPAIVKTKTKSTYNFTKFLTFGSRSNEVKQLQIRLQELGYLSKSIVPITNFGPATRAAVIKLQKEHKLTPAAGYVGPGTRGVLNGN